MTPVLGIIASSVLGAVTATSFESIATVTVGSGGAANVEFTSIPSTYSHLQIRLISRGDYTSDITSIALQFNADTGSNYAWHRIYGTGSAAEAGGNSSTTYGVNPQIATDNKSANIFGAAIIDILDYASTNKYKTVRTLGGWDANGSGRIALHSNLWQSNSAVSSIKLFPENSTSNFKQYSHFALYGIKSA